MPQRLHANQERKGTQDRPLGDSTKTKDLTVTNGFACVETQTGPYSAVSDYHSKRSCSLICTRGVYIYPWKDDQA